MATSLLLAVALLAWVGWRVPTRGVRELRASAESSLRARDREAFRSTIETAVRAHPAEPIFPLLAAAEAAAHDDPQTPTWLNRSMILAPGWPSPHVIAARWLARDGHVDQAMLELREAAALYPPAAYEVMCEVLGVRPEAALVERATPEAGGSALLELVAKCPNLPSSLAQEIDALLLARDPASAAGQLREAERAVEAGELDRAAELVRGSIARDPRSMAAHLLRARTLIARGETAEAIAALVEAEPQVPRPAPLIRLRAQTHASLGEVEEMREAVEALRVLSAGQPRSLADVIAYRARLERQSGNLATAISDLEEAYRMHPEPAYLWQVGVIAEELGDRRRALNAYERLVDHDPHNARYRAAVERTLRGLSGG